MKPLEKQAIQLLLADRDDLVREGIHSVVSRISGDVSINEVRTFAQLIKALSLQEYDLVIVEPLVNGKIGVEAVKHVRDVAPEAKVLIFTLLNEMTHGARSISYGAKGFLMKSCSVEEFLNAVKRIQRGGLYISTALAYQFSSFMPHCSDNFPYDCLTEKEKLVYSMLACGMRVIEVAKKLNLSQKTISTHKSRILSKFGFQNFTELLNYTVVHGLIDECRLRVEKYGNKN
jgi:DNA-binding NarL/FixJ family response regulator